MVTFPDEWAAKSYPLARLRTIVLLEDCGLAPGEADRTKKAPQVLRRFLVARSGDRDQDFTSPTEIRTSLVFVCSLARYFAKASPDM